MNDDFLHRLRKEPRLQFAARLRAQLRRQSLSPPPRVPSRARTLLTLLLLGGAAFALTAVAMRGLPPSLLVLYRHTAAWIAAERAPSPAHRAATEGIAEGLRWGGSGYGPADGVTPRGGGTTPSATQSPSAQSAATASSKPSAGSSSVGGVPAALGAPEIRVMASWSAYPYVTQIVTRVNIRNSGLHVDVAVRDSDSWPGPLCRSSAQAPNLAYAFEPAGRAISIPCPHDAQPYVPVRAIPIGYEAVAVARSPLYGELDVTRRQMFLALAAMVPDPSHPRHLRPNISTTWRQIDPALGPERIEIMGPPLESAAGRSMIELLMEPGCDSYPWIAALKSTHPDWHARICRSVRTSGVYGVYTEAPGLSSATLLAEPNAVGIFGFVEWNMSVLKELAVSKLDGVEPSLASIKSSAYPGSRALYLYTRYRVPPNVMFGLLSADFPYYPDWALIYPWSMRERAAVQAGAGSLIQ